MAPYVHGVLARACADGRAVVLTIDQSKVNDAHQMVTVLLRVGPRALPLAWRGGHNLDALCYCLGEFREVSAFAVGQRTHIPLEGTGQPIPMDVTHHLVVWGVVGEGTVVSAQVRSGMTRGREFLFEIHGSEGNLALAATARASTQQQELALLGGWGSDKDIAEMDIPAKYRWVPPGMPTGSPYNVGQLYAKLTEAIGEGKRMHPGFDAAIVRHRMLDMITRAARTGCKQAA